MPVPESEVSNNELLEWMKELHLYSVLYNFDIKAVWLPGSCNVIPDAISRFRYPNLRCAVICLIRPHKLEQGADPLLQFISL